MFCRKIIAEVDILGMETKKEFKVGRIEEAIRKKRFQQIGWTIGVLMVIGALILAGVSYSRWKNKNLPGVAYPNQGQEHVESGHQHEYNSNPPTSGWHFAVPSDWGVYKEELPDGTLIHNLEHGGIWISYKPGISEELRSKLESFYERYGRKVIVTPRAGNDTDIAVAAWTHLDKFNAPEYSDERVDKFIRAFRNKGPEFVP